MTYWNSAVTAIVRDGTTPPHLASLGQSLLSSIEQLRADILHSYSDLDLVNLDYALQADSSVAMGIMGDRGSGKSTLLVTVCAELLRRDQDIVLPIMKPELFSDTDTVLSSFLASLWLHFARSPQEAAQLDLDEGDADDSRRNLLRTIAETARIHAESQTSRAAIEHASEGPTDYADDAVSVARSGVRTAKKLRDLAQQVCVSDAGARLIVVPIDDPDLAASGVAAILRDLRILGSVPGVVPITCFTPSDLSSGWLASKGVERGLEGATRLLYQFQREMEKIFPYRTRFEIENLGLVQRRSFSPLGSDLSIGSLLEGLGEAVESEFGAAWPVAEALLADNSEQAVPSPLPSNPRMLVQLWDTLEALRSGPGGRPEVYLALRRLLDVIAEPFSIEMQRDPGDRPYSFEFHPDANEILPEFSISLPGVQLGVSARTSWPERRQDLANIDIRDLVRFRCPVRRPGASSSEDLTPAAVAALLAMQEIAFASGAFNEPEVGVYAGLAEWTFLQRVTLAGLATDDLFIMLPDAATIREVSMAGRVWNAFSEEVRADSKDVTTDVPVERILTLGVRAACETVQPHDDWDTNDYDAAVDRALSIYRSCTRSRSHTGDQFLEWFERYLPWQWHSAFFGQGRIRTFCKKYLKAVSQADRIPDALGFAKLAFDQRVGPILEGADPDELLEQHVWLGGYFDVAASLDSKHIASLGSLSGIWLKRVTAHRAGSAAAGSVSLTKGRRRFAAYQTPEGDELMRIAQDVLRRARDRAREQSGERR